MARTEASAVINRPIDEVFAYLIDVRNWSQWAGFPEAEQTSEGSVGVGATFRGVSQFLGRRAEWTSEVTNHLGGMSIEQSLTFEPVEGGTRLTMVGEAEAGGFFKLAEPVVNRMMQRQLEGNIANLKDILEAQA
jgi:uncharacterized protein YndB with AHSA1/START domain